MKKQNKSFASRAKELTNRYKRAAWNKMERDELEAELEKLSQEQETYKQANGIDQEQQQMQSQQGMQMFATGGTWRAANNYTIPQDFYSGNVLNTRKLNQFEQFADSQNMLPNYGTDRIWGNEYNNAFNSLGSTFNSLSGQIPLMKGINIDPNSGADIHGQSLDPNFSKVSAVSFSTPNINNESLAPMASDPSTPQGGLVPYQASIAPQLISAGIGVAGNMYLANQAKKQAAAQENLLKAGKVQPNLVNLAGARESARKEYTDAGNIAKRNLRTAGSRGAYLSGVGAAMTGLTKGKEQAVSDLYTKEGMMNAAAATQAINLNNQTQFQADAFNLQNKFRNQADQQAYTSAAIGTIPQAMRDVNMQRHYESMYGVMGEDYMYAMQPGAKFWQKPRMEMALKENVATSYKKPTKNKKK